MNTKKFVSMVTAASLFTLSLSGCSLLGGKDKAAIEETATSYIGYIMSGKLNKSAALVVDEEDYFQENAFPVQQEDLLSVVFESTEFEVENIEVNKNSGSAEIVFSIPDLDSIADEGYSFTEFLDAVGDIDDKVEETVELDFSKDGDEWLIEGDSTEDLFNLFGGIGADLEFGLSEGSAIEAVDTFVNYLAQGDVDGVLSMSPDGAQIFDSVGEIIDNLGDTTIMGNIFSSYYSRLEYTPSIVSANEDEVVVALDGTAPAAQAAVEAALEDPDVLTPIIADYIEANINGTYDFIQIAASLLDAVYTAENGTTETTDYSATVTVTADDEGNFYCDPDDGFFFDFDFPDITDSDALIVDALGLLLDQGRISQSDYNTYLAAFGGSSSGGYDVTEVLVTEGEDLFDYEYNVTADMIYVYVQTWDYYDTGDAFNYEISVNGGNAVSGQYVMPNDFEDMIEIQIPVDDPSGPSGSYVVKVFDEGSSSSVLIELEIIVITEGAPVTPGSVPAFGESMSTGNEGDDFYVFHFTDGNGNNYTDPLYPSNRGAVDFFVITWGYYDVGSGVDCDVYRDGEYVDTITGFNSQNATDTFTFSYEPNRLIDGDYVFRLHDVEDNGIICDAYCTVRTSN